MGMDGLSIANTGVVKESTSAEYANKTEQAIQSGAINDSRQVQSLGINQRVRPKEDDEGNSGRQQQQQQEEPKKEEVFEDGLVENPDEQIDDSSETDIPEVEDIENPNKDFYVKLNIKDDIIELYDSTTNKLIETISGNELGELVQKLNMASGIFVNKKV